MQFNRGSGPLVSILMPTRGRVPLLAQTIDSLYSLTKDKSLVEYCFKLDHDDSESIEFVQKLSYHMPTRVLISPRGSGYIELHNYINDLSAISKGDWLFIFNDDAKMKTEEWDQILLAVNPWSMSKWGGNQDICLLAPKVIEREISWEFPILRKATYDILGHFSLSYSSDAYIYGVMSSLNAAASLSAVEVTHFINELDDQTKREGSAAVNIPDNLSALSDKNLDELKDIDREKLRKHLEMQ